MVNCAAARSIVAVRSPRTERAKRVNRAERACRPGLMRGRRGARFGWLRPRARGGNIFGCTGGAQFRNRWLAAGAAGLGRAPRTVLPCVLLTDSRIGRLPGWLIGRRQRDRTGIVAAGEFDQRRDAAVD